MAQPKRSTPSGPLGGLYTRLKALGCTFCPTCNAYMYPDHVTHLANVWDRHTSRWTTIVENGVATGLEDTRTVGAEAVAA
jgi:hypothetical protein